jgi:hypothetical protein
VTHATRQAGKGAPGSSAGERSHAPVTEHEKAILKAEAHRLVAALGPYGVLSRDVLRREAGAVRWHEASFDAALDVAIAEGQIEGRPLSFYALRRRAPAPPDPRQ